jgi:hypothetical protein
MDFSQSFVLFHPYAHPFTRMSVNNGVDINVPTFVHTDYSGICFSLTGTVLKYDRSKAFTTGILHGSRTGERFAANDLSCPPSYL